ncbi:4-(cytidine 5'-diphospho)-2-C-methyl-D-erythritol kinase [bacterium]|nr:4-(cytidine 5'-diphospho)-2-C-methyl-D-erythritol kinase [bacterium]
MNKKIKVKAPAKINYTLEILGKRPDGYHNLKSIMQTINLYDYLTISVSLYPENNIILNSQSPEIPLDSSNTVYKATEKFLKKAKLFGLNINIDIEKNIPTRSGLGGGSSDAAAVLLGLNKLFLEPLSEEEINKICASIGSDVNFCLKGGAALCTSRGEITEPIGFVEQNISLIKPKNFGVSTKDAYSLFAASEDKQVPNNTEKLCALMNEGKFDENLLFNSFEKVLFNNYQELKTVKELLPDSLMTGSGAAFFMLEPKIETDIDLNKYIVFEGLKTIPSGAEVVYYEE